MGVRSIFGEFEDAAGDPLTGGWLVAVPNVRLSSSETGLIIPTKPVYAWISEGYATITGLLTTDTPGVTPEGWKYTIYERPRNSDYDSYAIELPAGSGPLNLADVEHLEPAPEMSAYIPAALLAEPGDILTRGPEGITAVGVGADGRVLTADSSAPSGLAWTVPSGGGGGSYYEHTQSAPSATWTVNHGLGYRPNVTVMDTDQNELDARISYTSTNSLQVRLSASTAGKAYLS